MPTAKHNFSKWAAIYRKQYPNQSKKEVLKAWKAVKQLDAPAEPVVQPRVVQKVEPPSRLEDSNKSNIQFSQPEAIMQQAESKEMLAETAVLPEIKQPSPQTKETADAMLQRLQNNYVPSPSHEELARFGCDIIEGTEQTWIPNYQMKRKKLVEEGMARTLAKYDKKGWLSEWMPEIMLGAGLLTEGFGFNAAIKEIAKQKEHAEKESRKIENAQ